MSEQSYATTGALDRLDARLSKEIEELAGKVDENSKAIIRLETLYETLSELPSALTSLEKAMVGIDHSLKNMNERMATLNNSVQEQRDSLEKIRKKNQEQDKDIEAVNNKSKIDWMDFVTGNFWNFIGKAVVIVAGAIVVYKALTGN